MNSIYSRGNVSYGLTRWMTMGAGVEYLSSVTSGPVMPFMNVSLRMGLSFLLAAEYTYGVRFKAVANYRLPSNLQFDAMYVRYDPDQKAINYDILEERKFVVSVPLSGKKISTYARLTLDHIILPQTSSATAELLFSGSFFGVNTNFTTYAMFAELSSPYYYSNLALGFRLPYGILLTPQAQFDYTNGNLISAKVEVEKQFFRRAYATVSYEQNFRSNISNLQVGFRFDFPCAQTEATYRLTNSISNFIESARGNFIADKKTGTVLFTDRTMVGTGGIVAVPFLDLNNDGHKQDGEPKLAGLNIRINGGMVQEDRKDTVLRILDMEAYTSYFLEADQNSIKNIAWRLKYRSFRVYVDPNRLKLVEIPVMIVGEASGYVNTETRGSTRGQGRIVVNFCHADGTPAGTVLSESDGYFSLLGLPAGKYNAGIDSAQLNRINMSSVPARIDFTVENVT